MKNTFEQQRRAVKKVAENRSRQLLEYGVPGMKWGARKIPTQLGKVQPKDYDFARAAKDFPKLTPALPGLHMNALALGGRLDRLAIRTIKSAGKAKTKLGKERIAALSRAAQRGAGRAYKVIDKNYGTGWEYD
jgi:hypothetical protein